VEETVEAETIVEVEPVVEETVEAETIVEVEPVVEETIEAETIVEVEPIVEETVEEENVEVKNDDVYKRPNKKKESVIDLSKPEIQDAEMVDDKD
jgi:hypothetical protein